MTFNIETRSGRARSGTMTDRKSKAKQQPFRSVDPDFSELLALLDGKTAREISEGEPDASARALHHVSRCLGARLWVLPAAEAPQEMKHPRTRVRG